MKSGVLKKTLATFVWKQGADIENLDVVVNASGGGSDIVAKQMPGRASRRAEGKERAYVIDFIHEWDWREDEDGRRKPGPMMSSDMSRRKSYSDLGFVQKTVESLDEIPILARN